MLTNVIGQQIQISFERFYAGIDRGCPEVCQRPRPPRKVQRLPGHREGGLAEGVGPDGGRREQEKRVKNTLLMLIFGDFALLC